MDTTISLKQETKSLLYKRQLEIYNETGKKHSFDSVIRGLLTK